MGRETTKPSIHLRLLGRRDLAQMQFVEPLMTEEEFLDQFANPSACGIGMSFDSADGPLAGFLIYHCLPRSFLLHYVVVLGRLRRRKLGTWLMDVLFSIAKEKGVRSVIARPSEDDRAAQDMLAKCEFKAIALLPGRYPPLDGILMIRRVTEHTSPG